MKIIFGIFLLAATITLNFNCKKSPDDCVCFESYEPVCGDDGVEYSNSCFAECAGVTYTSGFCTVETNAKVKDLGPVAADGCGWVLQFEIDGQLVDHHAENLSTDFQTDGLDVKIAYTPTLGTFSCGLVINYLPKINLISIEQI